jgi:hypothetical protein
MKAILACALASVLLVSAVPVNKRQVIDDGVILNYALTLEFLEAKFYTDALANFSEVDFESNGFFGVRENIAIIGADEQAHADFLSSISLPFRN